MTAASYRRQVNSPSSRESSVHQDSSPRGYLLAAVALAGCELAGMAAVVRGYQIAETTVSSTSEFAWFWIGMFLLELPLAGLVLRRDAPRTIRTALLTFYGIVSYAPKLLRDPTSSAYHDEFAHWRETAEILGTGKLFRSDAIIPIIARYPGLHAATAALVHATGLNIWQAATLLLLLFHVMLVLGIATLAQALGLGNRTSSLAAILYSLNSSFLYFDTQYAYESMAITLLVWTLVAYVWAIRSPSRQGRATSSVLTTVLSAGTVITHHLSAFTLLLIMAFISLAVSVPWLAKRKNWVWTAVTAWGLTLITAAMVGSWFLFVAPSSLPYLSPYISGGLSELMQEAQGSGAGRQLFGASMSPWWEQKSAYLVTISAFALAMGGLLWIRVRIRDGRLPRGRRRALLFSFTLSGLIYFPSTIFILSPAGAEGARRSWAFTWIGLCILAAPAAAWLLDFARRRAHQWMRVSMRSALAASLAIALVGGTAAGLDASYRFPGLFLYGSDARSVTPELLGTSAWFSARFGSGNNIVTDRYTGLIFGSVGLQNTADPSASFPTYNIYLAKPGVSIKPAYLLSELSSSDYTYLIVDKRMAYDLPQIGVYFEPDEPMWIDRRHGVKPVFYGRLDKFNTIQWMVKIFQSDNYSIYRLDLPAPKIGYQHQPPRLRGKLSVTP